MSVLQEPERLDVGLSWAWAVGGPSSAELRRGLGRQRDPCDRLQQVRPHTAIQVRPPWLTGRLIASTACLLGVSGTFGRREGKRK